MMSNDNPASILAVESVNKTYPGGTKPALDRVSFRVAPGEFFSILGPSGSGKTTILRMIAGFETPDRGRILMDGADITEVPPNRAMSAPCSRAMRCFRTSPCRTMSNIRCACRARPGPSAAADRRGARNGRHGLLRQPAAASRLSRRPAPAPALARAIVCRPKILLLDEPLGALDLKLRQQMQHTLVSLQKELGIAFIYVTHDQGEALSMSEPHRGHPGRTHRPARHRAGSLVRPDLRIRRAVRRPFQSDAGPLRANGRQAGCEHRRRELPGSGRTETGPARLALRFEAVTIVPEAEAPEPGGLKGIVEDVLFLGTNFEVNVRVGGLNVIASVPAAREGGFRAGQPVRLHLDLTNARVFND